MKNQDINKVIENHFNRKFDYDFNLHYGQIDFNHLLQATEDEILALIEYLSMECVEKTTEHEKDKRFLKLAREISTWSKDPSSKVGAVAISDNGSVILSQGYNGFPRQLKDDYRLYIRAVKYPLIVHAEMNMVFNATRNGVDLNHSTVYIWGLNVCPECAKGLLQVGVKRIVMGIDPKESPNYLKYKKSFDEHTSNVLTLANIQYTTIFGNPNDY